jgi:hypothetical protein
MIKKEHSLYLFYMGLSLALFFPSFDNSFRGDDFVFLRHVTEGTPLSIIFRPTAAFAFYRPGAIALFYMEHTLFGSSGGLYLLFNYLLHVAISLVAIRVFVVLGFTKPSALLAAGLFAIGLGHYGKQVMWASTSGPLVAILLSLFAFLLAVRWGVDWRRKGRLAGIIALLFVSMTFHEAALLTPFLLVLVIWCYKRERHPGRDTLLVMSAPVLWGIVLVVVAGHYTSYARAGASATDVPQYLLRYLGFMLVPLQGGGSVQSAVPGPAEILRGVAGYLQLFVGSIVFALIAALITWGGRTLRVLSAWVLIALLPFCFVALPKHWLELRYVYYASIPACGLIALGAEAMWTSRDRRRRMVVVALAIAVTVGAASIVRMLERKYDAMARKRTGRPASAAHALRGASTCSALADEQDRVLAAVPIGLVVGGVGIEDLLFVVDEEKIRVAPGRQVHADFPLAIAAAAHGRVDRRPPVEAADDRHRVRAGIAVG